MEGNKHKMKIESVEVIPMRKDSIFEEKYEDTFDCTITTSYEEWLEPMMNIIDKNNDLGLESIFSEFDSVCEEFAKSQKAYMIQPAAIFHSTMYIAKTSQVEKEELYAISNKGPLYMVYKMKNSGKYMLRVGVKSDS